jgi:hypothetical protein
MPTGKMKGLQKPNKKAKYEFHDNTAAKQHSTTAKEQVFGMAT